MNKTWKNILFIFLFSIFLSSLLFVNPLYRGHDTTFHVANVLAIEELFEYGKPFSLIIPNVAYNLGYGTRIFYPPLAHTLTALFSFLFSTTLAFKIVHFLTIFFSGVSMYFLSNKFSNSKYIAIFSSLFYISMPYFLSDIYIRCAIAESFLFVFIPMILLGLIYLLEGEVKKFYPLFVIGYVLGILSHLVLMVYGTILFGIFLLIYRKEFLKKEKLIPFLKACLVILLCTSFFLVPLLIHKIFGSYAVFQDGYMARDISYAALKISDFNPFKNVENSEVLHYLPVVVSVLLVFTYIFIKRIKFPKYTIGLLAFGLISFFMSSSLFPWDYLPYSFQIIQFPWRMQTFFTIIVSLFAPLCLLVIPKSKILNIVVILGLAIGSSLTIHFSWDVLIDFNNISWIDGMGWGYEYLPSSMISNLSYFKKRYSNQIIVLDSNTLNINILKNEVDNLSFLVSDLEDEVIIELPRIFYFGYHLESEDGSKIDLYENENGFISAKIDKNGIYNLTYVGFRFSRIISFASVFLFSGIYYISYIRKKNKVVS